jgi:hypothetical protein
MPHTLSLSLKWKWLHAQIYLDLATPRRDLIHLSAGEYGTSVTKNHVTSAF